jgi:tetratricopeptide (TPR) repeat protein
MRAQLRSPTLVLAWVAALAVACATPPPLPKPSMPTRPIDVAVPLDPPDEGQLARLPAAWDQEALRSVHRLETGPLLGAGNFNDLDGPLLSAFARNPYAVADGADNERKLVTRLPSEKARPFMDAGNREFGAGQLDEAFTSYRGVIERDPLFAKPYFYLAEIETKRHDLDAATAWNDRGLRLSPRDAYGHALRAEIASTLGRTAQMRSSLAFALVLDPFAPRVLKLLRQLGGRHAPGIEPPIFVELRSTPGQPRPVLVARAGGHPAWQRYAICRALLAHDPQIRREFIQSPLQTRLPGTRSLEEETTCGYMATAAYRAAGKTVAKPAPKTVPTTVPTTVPKTVPTTGPIDADLERWSQAYDANLLREAVIYDTLGCRRPEVLPSLSDEVFDRVVEYVRRFVLPPSPPGAPTPTTGNNQ